MGLCVFYWVVAILHNGKKWDRTVEIALSLPCYVILSSSNHIIGLFPQFLNLGWTCDLHWVTECITVATMLFQNLKKLRSFVCFSSFSFSNLPYTEINQVILLVNERTHRRRLSQSSQTPYTSHFILLDYSHSPADHKFISKPSWDQLILSCIRKIIQLIHKLLHKKVNICYGMWQNFCDI